MKAIALFLSGLLFAGTAAALAPVPLAAQTSDVKSSQDVAPDLIEARNQAENDLKQVHLLARYQSSAQASPVQDLATIDSQYDDLAASINGYLQGFAAAVQLPGPLDDAKWKTRGTAVLAQASTFDDSMKKVRAANSASSGTRVFFLLGIVNILEQVVLPGAAGYQKIKGDAESASQLQRKQIADVFMSALWRDSATVLSPPKPAAAVAAPSPK